MFVADALHLGALPASSAPHTYVSLSGRFRYFTSVPATPEELHALGLSEVERITKLMDGVRNKVGGNTANLTEFVAYVKENMPQYYPKNGDEIMHSYQAVLDDAYKILPEYFSRMPDVCLAGVSRVVWHNLLPSTDLLFSAQCFFFACPMHVILQFLVLYDIVVILSGVSRLFRSTSPACPILSTTSRVFVVGHDIIVRSFIVQRCALSFHVVFTLDGLQTCCNGYSLFKLSLVCFSSPSPHSFPRCPRPRWRSSRSRPSARPPRLPPTTTRPPWTARARPSSTQTCTSPRPARFTPTPPSVRLRVLFPLLLRSYSAASVIHRKQGCMIHAVDSARLMSSSPSVRVHVSLRGCAPRLSAAAVRVADQHLCPPNIGELRVFPGLFSFG